MKKQKQMAMITVKLTGYVLTWRSRGHRLRQDKVMVCYNCDMFLDNTLYSQSLSNKFIKLHRLCE